MPADRPGRVLYVQCNGRGLLRIYPIPGLDAFDIATVTTPDSPR